MNKETIEGLKKRRVSLKKKLDRLIAHHNVLINQAAEVNSEIDRIENDLEGLNEILTPHETLEKL